MNKEMIVKSINGIPGSPDVVLTLVSKGDLTNPPPQPKAITNMKDMQQMMGGVISMMQGGMQDNTTKIKMQHNEYRQLGIGVGDLISLNIRKVDISGV